MTQDDATGAETDDSLAAALSEPASATGDQVAGALVHGDAATRTAAVEAYAQMADGRTDATTEVQEALGSFLRSEEADERRDAATAVALLARERPSGLDAVVPALVATASAETGDERERALLTLAVLAPTHPDAAADAIPAAGDALASGRTDERRAAVALAGAVADDRPAEAAPVAPELLAFLDEGPARSPAGADRDGFDPVDALDRPADAETDEYRMVREEAARALGVVAPHVSAGAFDAATVASLLDDENPRVRATGCELLAAVAVDDPAAAKPHLSTLASLLLSDAVHPVPWKAAVAVVTLGEAYPDDVAAALEPGATEFVQWLDDPDPGVRGVGAGLLAQVAERYPESAEPGTERLRDLLAADSAHVRGNTASALGALADEAALTDLERLAATDSDLDVRALAAEAAERIRES